MKHHSYKEQWENPNLCKLQKFNVIKKKGSYPLPFIDDVLNIVASHDVYSFLDGYIFWVPLDIYTTKGQIQNNICDRLGGIHMGSYVFWGKKWPNLL